MYKRAYFIKLKPDAPAERVDALVETLERAPEHITSMVWSTVSREQSIYDYDLVWDHAFEDEAANHAYSTHAYHCNRIDDYMYRESALSSVAEAICLKWDENDDLVTPLEPPPAEDGPDSTIYLLEQVEVVPGAADEYLAAVHEEYLPLAEPKGLRLVGAWRQPEGNGEHEVTLLWAVPGWHAWHRIRFAMYGDEPAFSNWLARAEKMRVAGRRRLLEPSGFSPLGASAAPDAEPDRG